MGILRDDQGNAYGHTTGEAATVFLKGGGSFELKGPMSIVWDEDHNTAFNFDQARPRIGYIAPNAVEAVVFHDD